MLNNFKDDTKLSGVADTVDSRTRIQNGLEKLEKSPEINPIKFHMGTCKVLHLRQNNQRNLYTLGIN